MAKTGTVKATWPGHKRPVQDRDMYGPLPAHTIPWAKAKKKTKNINIWDKA